MSALLHFATKNTAFRLPRNAASFTIAMCPSGPSNRLAWTSDDHERRRSDSARACTRDHDLLPATSRITSYAPPLRVKSSRV